MLAPTFLSIKLKPEAFYSFIFELKSAIGFIEPSPWMPFYLRFGSNDLIAEMFEPSEEDCIVSNPLIIIGLIKQLPSFY